MILAAYDLNNSGLMRHGDALLDNPELADQPLTPAILGAALGNGSTSDNYWQLHFGAITRVNDNFFWVIPINGEHLIPVMQLSMSADLALLAAFTLLSTTTLRGTYDDGPFPSAASF